MKVLFVGGYGNISWYCTKKAIELGYDVFLLNREQTTKTRREIPKEAKVILADYRDFERTKNALKNEKFDVVCDFICYNGQQAQQAVETFRGTTKQYIFISSDSVYKTPDADRLFRETSEKYQLGESSPYINGKLEAESVFIKAYENEEFPVTIVRPGYTYDTIMPYSIGHNCFTTVQRCIDGKPLLIAGNGNNKWTFTHSRDFAQAFVQLFAKEECIGEDYQLSGDCVESFNTVMYKILQLLGVKTYSVIHIPPEGLLKHEEFSPKDMLHRLQNRVFDNSKIKSIAKGWETKIGIDEGLKETITWMLEKPERQRFVKTLDDNLENLTKEFYNLKEEINIHGQNLSYL